MTAQSSWLALVGLGLEPGGISHAGLERAQQAEHVYLEAYTAQSPEPVETLEDRLETAIRPLKREPVEEGTLLLEAAQQGGCCLLVAGDPFSATTHTSLRLQAHQETIPVHIHFSASILTAAAGTLGLSHYKFGRTTTLVTPEADYFPQSPYDVIRENQQRGLHTLVLLDIRDDGTCMQIDEAATLLQRIEHERQDAILAEDTHALAIARAGRETANAWRGPLDALTELDAGEPMHSIVIPGELSPVEDEALDAFTTRVR